MRVWIVVLAALAAACSRPAEDEAPPPSAPHTETMQGEAAVFDVGGAHRIDAAAIIGTWSFDHSCASGDGMTLSADGYAGFDEWGMGAWRIDESGRLVLDLATHDMGAEAPAPDTPRRTLTLEASAPVSDRLVGVLEPDGRAIDAVRCPIPG